MCRIIRPAEMTMAEQLAAMQETDVVILTFGAQVANLMFLPPVSPEAEHALALCMHTACACRWPGMQDLTGGMLKTYNSHVQTEHVLALWTGIGLGTRRWASRPAMQAGTAVWHGEEGGRCSKGQQALHRAALVCSVCHLHGLCCYHCGVKPLC